MTEPIRVERVEIERDETDVTSVIVWPYWTAAAPLDRPEGVGYSCGTYSPRALALAARMKAAMLAGAVFYDATVRRDVNGRSYVDAKSRVLGRRMNADLRRLGF